MPLRFSCRCMRCTGPKTLARGQSSGFLRSCGAPMFLRISVGGSSADPSSGQGSRHPKTWSGNLTGIFAGAVLGSAIGGHGLGLKAQAPLFALGLAASAVSQAGDIFESWVKRRFGLKDSSGLIPGHGGFMDRLDGFIAAAAFAAILGAARDKPSIAAGLFVWN
jgi:Cytidylyltransferase family